MAAPVLEACRNAGVFTLVTPRELGGADVGLPELFAIFEELGYSDPTIGWHAGNSFALAGNASYLGPAEREMIFAQGPGPFGFSGIAGGIAHEVDGGFRLSGRWQFVTGCLDAPYAWLHGTVHDGDRPRLIGEAPDARAFIVPSSEFVIDRTWEHASAMRGTGSHAVSVQDVFVPNGFVLSLLKMGRRQLSSRAARWPFGASSPVTNAAICVGIARRSVEEAIRLIKAQSPRMAYTPYRDRADIQQSIAAAMTAVNAYSAGLQAMAEEVQAAALEEPPIPESTRARMWASLNWTIDQTRLVVSEMARISTSSVYGSENPTEMALRDVHAICASMEAFRDAEEAAGRVYLGMPPNRIPF